MTKISKHVMACQSSQPPSAPVGAFYVCPTCKGPGVVTKETLAALAASKAEAAGGEAVDQPPKGWSPCRRCNRPDPACQRKDCDRCGGSGWRKKCNALDCIEYGCNGYGFCLVTPEEVTAALSAPAVAVEAVAWVAVDTLNSPHPRCISSLAYMSQLDRDQGREYAPICLQSAIDTAIRQATEGEGK